MRIALFAATHCTSAPNPSLMNRSGTIVRPLMVNAGTLSISGAPLTTACREPTVNCTVCEPSVALICCVAGL